MQSNFAFLQNKAQFRPFAGACLEAEKALVVSPATAAILARRGLELAVKWVYEFDTELKMPYQDNLSSLIHDAGFRSLMDDDMLPFLRYVVKLGNAAVHTNSPINREEAVLSLNHLHTFVSWIDYCYAEEYTARDFDDTLLAAGEAKRESPEALQRLFDELHSKDKLLKDMMDANEKLKRELTERRKASERSEAPFDVKPPSELATRKRYIDLDLKLAGWNFDANVQEEVEVTGMPNASGTGAVDYVLYGDNGKPLAIVEAKRTSIDPKQGQQQAKLYADCLEQMTGQRPVIFYTNGYETHIWDDFMYPPRTVSGFYTKDELMLLIDRRMTRKPLVNIDIKDGITNRYYQKEAILSVCEAISQKQRKMLLVMATGSGKTRTAISIVDVLARHNWVKNVLFLADRTTLVRQAKANFSTLLPGMSLCNLLDSKDSPEGSRIVFSTYPTMMNAIDETKNKEGKRLFTVGHFDLIIVDESHRSIYKKYRAIFDYFDGMLLGLTATPKDEIDFNTYEIFDLERGVPTYAYELEQAVEDGYLVDYRTIETKLKFLEEGIKYDDLTEEEKEQYEETFEFEEEESEDIDSAALNEWLFNSNTIDRVLQDVMEKGVKVEGGDKLGKTIIFAKTQKHAEAIERRFNSLYPAYSGGFLRVVTYKVNYAQSLIEDFSDRYKFPQIAVSVDMLDTGVDIPDVVNLVFFKKVRSKAKFWQMIGRGTRLSPDLYGVDEDKTHFLIFDYLGNFDFFRENPKGIEGNAQATLTEKLFNVKVDIIKELQSLEYQAEQYTKHRAELVGEALKAIKGLDEEHFRVRQQLKAVQKFKESNSWNSLTSLDTKELKTSISPLLSPIHDDELAKRFDLIMYTIELAKLQIKNATKPIRSVVRTAEQLSKIGTIPAILDKKHIIEKVQIEAFWEEADIFELEEVREAIRELVKFLERETQKIYYTNFEDEVMEVKESGSMLQVNELQSYKKKVRHYLRQHQDELAIYKLRHNKPLTQQDVEELERVLWTELGTREDYEKEFGETPITKLVRTTVGLDIQAANEAFSQFLSEEKLNLQQSHFVKLIIDYIVKNGVMEKQVLQEDPFRSAGSIVELFKDNLDDARKILAAIEAINRNTEEIS